ncbi:MAG: hypothetical protein HBSAPP03_03980 [Phycisphaerae bacterium]|nr:MAG: hypothetical protein HBSAPP03_03980 [Phycisphaerae bacterium]
MGGKALSARIDRSDIAALRKAGAPIEMLFDASHPLKVKAPHLEIKVSMTEPQRMALAKNAWGTCQKFFMHTDGVKKLLASGARFEVKNYDRAFMGESAAIKDAWKKLEAGDKAGMIRVKVP